MITTRQPGDLHRPHRPHRRRVDHQHQQVLNHLGHFALTGHLLPALTAAKTARVITVSAKVSRNKNATLDDPLNERTYSGMAAYTKSKLSNVVFTVELARRSSTPFPLRRNGSQREVRPPSSSRKDEPNSATPPSKPPPPPN